MDELPPYARALLDAARNADDPTEAQRTRVDAAARARLAVHGMRDLPAVSSGASAQLPAAKLTVASILPWGGLFAAALMATVLVTRALLSPQAAPVPAVVPRAPDTAAAVVESSAPVRPAQPSAPRLSAEPEQSREAQPVRARNRPHPAGNTRVPSAADDSALQHGLRVIAAADELVRRAHFDEALSLLDRSEHEPAARSLREERSALRVLAACGKAPNSQARRERQRFLQLWPQSLLAARVRAACTARAGERE